MAAKNAEALTIEDVMSPDRYAAHGYPHEAWRLLREQAPLRWFDFDDTRPGFWAVTRRADIVWLSKQPKRFLNAPRQAIFADSPPQEARAGGKLFRNLLNMDPPEHGELRKLASAWFTPRAIGRRRAEVERIADDLIDGLAERGRADFVADFAAPLTLSVLADMLGVPRADWQMLFRWTNQAAGAGDPEFQSEAGEVSTSMQRAIDEMFAYFSELAAERRSAPRDDIVSVLANAQIAGGRLPEFELLSYLALLVVAGNETTRNAASGGLLALIESPEELAKLRADPGLVNPAVEEVVRWTSPVIQFCRTPVEDLELHGRKVRAGEALCLFYPSANRDAAAFSEPDALRVDRRPNPHVGFGIGEHFCLGANLARLELRVICERLLPRLDEVALAGSCERMRSSFLGGVKRMPIAYRLNG